ncbi:MAG: glycosyltransferase [Phycisphaeraceae bacterium]|nr:glycosyltransferase [Phycisphaeraceae bacterium]
MPNLAAIVCTHTPRHLRWTLLGLATQTRKPDHTILSTDGVVPEVESVARAAASDFNLPITLVQRPHAGIARSGQVRNNAVRALTRAEPPPHPDTLLVFFDGDMFPTPTVLAAHQSAVTSPRAPADFVVAGRVELTEQQTDDMLESDASAAKPVAQPTPAQLAALRREHRRAERDRLLRTLGPLGRILVKPHKPKILGANFSVTLKAFLAVNGFDERFEGYGQEDDDLSRRLLQARFRPAVITANPDALNLHRWHPTRAPTSWAASPTVALLHAPAPTHAAEGLTNPRAQSDLSITAINP